MVCRCVQPKMALYLPPPTNRSAGPWAGVRAHDGGRAAYGESSQTEHFAPGSLDPFEQIATQEVELRTDPRGGIADLSSLTKIALHSAVEAFADAQKLEGWNKPVFVGGAVYDPVVQSAINATSAIQRHTKTYANPQAHAKQVTALQETIALLMKSRVCKQTVGSKYFRLAEVPEYEAGLLQDLAAAAMETVADSPTWTSKFWQEALKLENVETMTIIPERVRAAVSRENKLNEDEDEDTAADGPYTRLSLFLEVPGIISNTVTPLARCLMTKASMAAGGRLFHVMNRLNLPAEKLQEMYVPFKLKDAFYCPPQPARSEIGVSLVDMFDPIRRYSDAPTGSLVRISLRMPMGSPFDTCMPWISTLTTPSKDRDGENKWDAQTMHAWYAFSRHKMEEVATLYQRKVQLLYTSALPYEIGRRSTLEQMLKRHEQINHCLVAFGAQPRLLAGVDGPAGMPAVEEDPATRANRPANLPTGLENNALTQELILGRYATQQPRRLGQDGYVVQDVAC